MGTLIQEYGKRSLGLLLVLQFCLIGYANGQELGLARVDGDDPITIEADSGIEWKQEYSVVTARGNARAVRGDVEVRADSLSAFYRDRTGGEAQIWRLEAVGDVRISSLSNSAYGQRGVYDVDKAVFVLSGPEGVRFVGDEGTVSADGQLEFWERDRLLIARGNARARQGDRGLDADVLVAHLAQDESGATQLERIEAFDAVHVYTAEESVRADRGVYEVASGLASLSGAVRVIRGQNRLRGCRAQVDVTEGVSKLFGCGPEAGGRQVRGLIRPERTNELSTNNNPN